MEEENYLKDKFKKVCFTLSKNDIYELERIDNGPLTNVITNINSKCYGVYLDTSDKLLVEFVYITNNETLKGDILRLELNDPDYIDLLFMFCDMLANVYDGFDTLDAFNTFQIKLRPFLEKIGFTTVTTEELKIFKGQSIAMMATSLKGIKKIKLFNKIDFYRDFFSNNYVINQSVGKEYVYLMLNNDTSLIKIGYSKTPNYRERTLHSQEPSIHLIACWETEKIKEKELHKKYNAKKIRGEWFRLTLSDLKEIEEYMNQDIN